MLGYKSKSQAKDSAKLVVLTGRNPQRYLEWEAQALHAIKSRCGKIGIEHWQGRQPYTVGERQEDSYAQDDLVDRLRDGRIHDCSYQGMRES